MPFALARPTCTLQPGLPAPAPQNPTEDLLESKIHAMDLQKQECFTIGQLAHMWWVLQKSATTGRGGLALAVPAQVLAHCLAKPVRRVCKRPLSLGLRHPCMSLIFFLVHHLRCSMLEDLTDEEEILKRAFYFFDKHGNGACRVTRGV